MAKWDYGFKKILITKEEIAKKVKELGEQITKDYINDSAPLVVVGILKGSVVFMADLIREIHLPLSIEFMEVSSYGNDFSSTRDVKIIKDLDTSVQGKNVLVVEDIIDSGYTLKKVLKYIGGKGPKKVILCTLLNKKERREVDIDVQYVGFEIPDEFVTGYGLDYKQEYRNIPYIGVMDAEKIDV